MERLSNPTESGLDIKPRSTLNTPHGEMYLMGTNERTGKIILAGPNGMVETTPDELGAWQAIEARNERFREAEAAEDAGEVAVENTVKLPESVHPEENTQSAVGEMVLSSTSSGGEDEPGSRRPLGTDFDIELGDEDVVDEDGVEPHIGDGGGGEPPEEPPELPPGGGGDEEEPGGEDEDDPIPPPTPPAPAPPPSGTGGGGGDLEDRARLAHLRMETVHKAAELGVGDPIDYLVRARRSEKMRKQLEVLGYDFSPPPDKEVPVPPDPDARDIREGEERRDKITEIAQTLNSPRRADIVKLRKKLVRPGTLPFKLHLLPSFGIAKRLARDQLAGAIYLQEVRDRDPNKTYDDGPLNTSRERIREIRDGLDLLDHNIKVERSKLSWLNRRKLKGPLDSKRRDAAEIILRELDAIEDLKHRKLSPAYQPDYDKWKKARDAYRESLDHGKILEDRNEFVRLRSMGVRNAKQQAHFDKFLEKYPYWT